MLEIKNNYLTNIEYDTILSKINDKEKFNWFFSDHLNDNSKSGQFQFLHTLVNEGKLNSPFTFICDILLSKLKKPVEVKRARVNLFIKTKNKQDKLGFHQDVNIPPWLTLLYYLETSNGYTDFKTGEKVESVKNRAVIFPANMYHQTITQTDKLFRKNININFRYIGE